MIAIDCESHLIKPGCLAPKLVCLSWAKEGQSGLMGIDQVLEHVRYFLQNETIVGQNLSFDFGVLCAEFPELLPLVFQAYEAGRIRDTMIRQKLIDISKGEHKFYWAKKSDGSSQRMPTKHTLEIGRAHV